MMPSPTPKNAHDRENVVARVRPKIPAQNWPSLGAIMAQRNHPELAGHPRRASKSQRQTPSLKASNERGAPNRARKQGRTTRRRQ